MSKNKIKSLMPDTYKKSSKTKKFIFILLGLLIFIAATIVILAYFYYLGEISRPYKIDSKNQSFRIEKGESIDSISKKLENLGLLSSSYILKVYLYLNSNKTIQAGIFRLQTDNINLIDLVEKMQNGSFTKKLTFVEGWRLEQYYEYLDKEMGKEFADKFKSSKYIKEGYMFPDTYIIELDYDPENLASMMRNTFDKKIGESTLELGQLKGLNKDQVLILASIVQREMNISTEMPKVAGVLLNRINSGWPLQADATIQYAIGKKGNWWPVIKGSDTRNTNSLYNTYLHKELPPGPICNPSKSAIEAVVNAPLSDFYFYLSENDGTTHYAKTLEEHNANIQKYLK